MDDFITPGFLEPPAPDEDSWPDIPGYDIKREIRRGGMGVVYEAEDLRLVRRVALKVMQSRIDPRLLEREASLQSQLKHPNIATLYEVGSYKSSAGTHLPYFAIEYIEDARPITEFAGQRELPLRERVELFCAVCDAVYHGHWQGIVHRDLKPDNILVGEDGIPKVIDFGIAQALDTLAATAGIREMLRGAGTYAYMSPEQKRKDIDRLRPATDVYSLGLVLHQLVCGGRLPESGKDAPERAVSMPRRLRRVLDKALKKEHSDRYLDGAAFRDALHEYLNPKPWVKQHAIAIAVTAALILLGSTAYTIVRRDLARAHSAISAAESTLAGTEEKLARTARAQWDLELADVPGPWLGVGADKFGLASTAAGAAATRMREHRFEDAAEGYRSAISLLYDAVVAHDAAVERQLDQVEAALDDGDENYAKIETDLGAADDHVRLIHRDAARLANLWKRLYRAWVTARLAEYDEAEAEQIRVDAKRLARLLLDVDPDDVESRRLMGHVCLRFIDMIEVPASSFIMGRGDWIGNMNERPAERRTVTRAFRIAATEITQGQYLAVMRQNPSYFGPEFDVAGDSWYDRPVEHVTILDAEKFCERYTALEKDRARRGGGPPIEKYRLPSEVEWEYACRAGSTTAYPRGMDVDDEYMWHRNRRDCNYRTHAVGRLRHNAWGLYDVHGNVWEWCADHWHPHYVDAPDDQAPRLGGRDPLARVARGGSWFTPNPTASIRAERQQTYEHRDLGFRIVQDLPASSP